jgi:hypothetical protein
MVARASNSEWRATCIEAKQNERSLLSFVTRPRLLQYIVWSRISCTWPQPVERQVAEEPSAQ